MGFSFSIRLVLGVVGYLGLNYRIEIVEIFIVLVVRYESGVEFEFRVLNSVIYEF